MDVLLQCIWKVTVQLEVMSKNSSEKNWIKQLHTLPVLHFNRCLTTEYTETTAHFNGDFDTDNQIYVP
jgi:hypothetical protein